MRKSSILSAVIVICLVLTAGWTPVSAAGKQVKVTIPSFGVEINGKKMDNKRAAYPPLTYKGVTYLPMTSNVARALGLHVKWSKKSGLEIASGTKSGMKDDRKGSNILSKTYSATVASYPIKINGIRVDNVSQKYPILQFRDIAYLLMTWHYTHDVFGWETERDAKNGYHIRSQQFPSLLQIFYDDDDFLYAGTNGNGICKFSKNLNGRFTPVTEKENNSILDLYRARNDQYEFPYKENSDQLVVSRNGAIYYNDQKLVSLEPYLKQVEQREKEENVESGKAAKTDGFFTVDSNLAPAKIADSIPGIAYAGRNKQIYVVNPDKNTITNVTTKKSYRWWDYELRPNLP